MQHPSRHAVARHNSSVRGQVVQHCRVCVFLYSSPLIALRIQLGQSVKSSPPDGSSKMQQPSRTGSNTLQHQRFWSGRSALSRLYVAVLIPTDSLARSTGAISAVFTTRRKQQPNRAGSNTLQHQRLWLGCSALSRLCVPVLIPTDSLEHSTGAISAVLTTRRKQQPSRHAATPNSISVCG
jgi:uncharacterized protein (DUF2384 family)